ncbi:MAG TPA: bifunctional DNA primase/polymerase, partial [Polyangiaceae bacterium]|nr:bifunctional DNA primase/polymerase [Polyangiaceae bacterium]
VRRWWGNCVEYGIGIATGEPSGVFVLDIDPRNGGDETLGALERRLGALPTTVRVLTGRGDGGTHFFYRYPTGLVLHGKLGEGVDVKASGAYVVAPPSIHPDTGKPYRWDLGALPSETPIATAPAWMLDALTNDPVSSAPLVALPGVEARDTVLGVAFELASMLGGLLPNGARMVRCPWESEHTDERGTGTDSSTVIMPPTTPKRWGAFCCLHAHCSGRTYDDVIRALPRQAVAVAYARFGARLPRDLSRVDAEPRTPIRITTSLHENVDAAIEALRTDTDLYQRDGKLVHVTRTTADEEERSRRAFVEGSPQIREMEPATLCERLTRAASWEKFDKRSRAWDAALPSERIVAAVHARKQWSGIRPIVGIIEAPTLRPDGTIVQTAGYDESTGYLFEPSGTFPPISDRPSEAEAKAALGALEEVFCDFPYLDGSHAVVPVAGILTLLARPAIVGAVPAFAFDASTRGTGKTLQTDGIAIVATGRGAPRKDYPTRSHTSSFGQSVRVNEEEMEKVLGAYALRGVPLFCFDNLTCPFGCGALDAVLTASDTVDLRVLGKSEVPTLPWRAVVLATGNNLALSGDTARRVLISRLETSLERPEGRTDFRHPDLRAWARGERPRLVAAGLTLLRAYCVAGRPDMGCARWGSFEAWSRFIPHAIVFAGGVDPMLARPTHERDLDDEARAIATVLEFLPRLDANDTGLSSKTIVSSLYPIDRFRAEAPPDGFDDLREAIEALCPTKPGTAPDTVSLGNKFRSFKGRNVGGRKLVSVEGRGHTVRWRVVEVT